MIEWFLSLTPGDALMLGIILGIAFGVARNWPRDGDEKNKEGGPDKRVLSVRGQALRGRPFERHP